MTQLLDKFREQGLVTTREFKPQKPSNEPQSQGDNVQAKPEKKQRPKHNDWRDRLQIRDNGNTIPNLLNASILAENEVRIKASLGFNEFAGKIEALRDCLELGLKKGQALDDHHTRRFQTYAQSLGLQISRDTAFDAISMTAQKLKHDPIKQYLNGLKWDGVSRLENWLVDYFKTDDTPLIRAISRKFLISAVARGLDPGCKVDTCLVLGGGQGAKKSTAVRILGGKYTSENLPSLESREAQMHLSGFWFIEIAELDAMRKVANTKLKQFMSTQVDDYRAPYDKCTTSHPRRCVFIATTNEQLFFKDPTGSRRFWPVTVGESIDHVGLKEARDQLFAEAVHEFNAGAKWWLEDSEIQEHNEAIEERAAVDPWVDAVSQWLEVNQHESYTSESILLNACGVEVSNQNPNLQQRLGVAACNYNRLDLQSSMILSPN